MPVLPKDDTEGVRTRSQRQLEVDVRRMESSPSPVPHRVHETMTEPTSGTSGVAPGIQAPAFDLTALMTMLQEQQARVLEEQARRHDEQTRLLQEQQARVLEEQAQRQEEQAQRQEEQAQRQEEQARLLQEQQARLMEGQAHFFKDLQGTIQKELQGIKDKVENHESRIFETETQIADVKKALGVLKAGGGNIASVMATPAGKGFKMPSYDGTSSWAAYKKQLEAVVKANGWTADQAMTALTLALRDQALNVLEIIGNDVTYEQLLEALESRYGDAHLEHMFRAQFRDRTQRNQENLQQWAQEAEKMVRKAYHSQPAVVEGILVQTFVDGIRDREVKATVGLGHHKTLKDALTHALEIEAWRQDHRSHRIREMVASAPRENRPRYSPRCFECGEKGHLRANCPKQTTTEYRTQIAQATSSSTYQQQGNE